MGADIVMFPSSEGILDEVSLLELPNLVVLDCGWSIVRQYILNWRGMLSIKKTKSLKFHWKYFEVWKAAVELLKYCEVSGIWRD